MSAHSCTRRTLLTGGLVASATLALSQEQAAAAARSPLASVRPLAKAHAHNDYEHTRPLFDALEHGFTSVEADVWLVDGELYLGHDGPDLSRTLRSFYLEPLDRLARLGNGRTFPRRKTPIQLLIDIKSDGDAAWPVVQQQLSQYPKLMTHWVRGRRRDRAVTAVLSGNLAQRTSEVAVRWAGFDGRLTSPLPAGANSEQLPLLSDNWTKLFTWQGFGPMPAAERTKLHRIVSDAHAGGYRVRFWATPDLALPNREALWSELVAAGVDHINTDDLAGLRSFLSNS